MRIIPAFLLALGVAGPALSGIVIANPFNDQLLRLSRPQQEGVLRQAITRDKQRCGQISGGAYRGRYGNLAMWVAHCKPGGDYAVFIGPHGEAQVRSCRDTRELKLPSCGKVGR
ncbi:MAG TPA: hypothetical protein VFL92_04460 [Sphingomonas sp.]|nr:hypothetical protein [Sphingomonas sp.]